MTAHPEDRETELVVQCSLVIHWLLCKLNKATQKDSLPLLKVENLSDPHDCTQHLTSQVALLITFPTHNGVFQFRVKLFGVPSILLLAFC